MRTFSNILFHVLSAALISGLMVWMLFYVALPLLSRYGETVTVPNVVGMHASKLEGFLAQRRLSFRVAADSDFSVNDPPFSVLKQLPLPQTRVKAYRKIIVTLNAKAPPLVPMPHLIDGSVKRAQILLKTNRLQLGHINYVPDLAQNAILEQYWEGAVIQADSYLPQGSRIDLDVGNGLGRQTFSAPNLLGIHAEEAETDLISTGLRLRNRYYKADGKHVFYREDPEGDSMIVDEKFFAPGLVIDQDPEAETEVRIGDYVDIWISGEPPE